VLPTVTNEIDVAFTPPPGGVFAQEYESNGPNGVVLAPPHSTARITSIPRTERLTGDSRLRTEHDGYCTSFTYDPNNPPVYIVYILGAGSAGVTGGGKTGLGGVNLGLVQSSGDAVTDPNPRVSVYGR